MADTKLDTKNEKESNKTVIDVSNKKGTYSDYYIVNRSYGDMDGNIGVTDVIDNRDVSPLKVAQQLASIYNPTLNGAKELKAGEGFIEKEKTDVIDRDQLIELYDFLMKKIRKLEQKGEQFSDEAPVLTSIIENSSGSEASSALEILEENVSELQKKLQECETSKEELLKQLQESQQKLNEQTQTILEPNLVSHMRSLLKVHNQLKNIQRLENQFEVGQSVSWTNPTYDGENIRGTIQSIVNNSDDDENIRFKGEDNLLRWVNSSDLETLMEGGGEQEDAFFESMREKLKNGNISQDDITLAEQHIKTEIEEKLKLISEQKEFIQRYPIIEDLYKLHLQLVEIQYQITLSEQGSGTQGESESLQEEYSRINEQINNILDSFDSNSEQKNRMLDKVSEMGGEIESYKRRNEQLASQLNNSVFLLSEREKEINNLIDKIYQLEGNIKLYKEQIYKIQANFDEIDGMNKLNIQSIDEKNATIDLLNAEIGSLKEEINNLQQNLDSTNDEKSRNDEETERTLKELQEQLDVKNNELIRLSRNMDNVESKNFEMKTDLENKTEELIRNREDFELKLRRLQETINSLTKEKEDSEGELKRLNNEQKTGYDNKLVEKDSVLAQKNAELKANQEQIVSLEHELRQLQERHGKNKLELEQINRQKEDLESRFNELESVLAQSEDSVAAIETDRATTEQEKRQLESSIDDKNNNIQRLERQLGEKNRELEERLTTIEENQATIESLQKRITELQQKGHANSLAQSKEMGALRSENENLKEEKTSLVQELSDLRSTNSQLQTECDSIRSENDSMIKDIKNLRSKLAELEALVTQKDSEIQQLKALKNTMAQQIISIQNQNESLALELQQKTTQIDDLKRANENNLKEKNDKQTQIERIQKEHAEKISVLEESKKSDIENLEQKNKEYVDTISDLERKIGEIQIELSSKERQLENSKIYIKKEKQLEDVKTQLETQLTQAGTELDVLNSEKRATEDIITDLERKLAQCKATSEGSLAQIANMEDNNIEFEKIKTIISSYANDAFKKDASTNLKIIDKLNAILAENNVLKKRILELEEAHKRTEAQNSSGVSSETRTQFATRIRSLEEQNDQLRFDLDNARQSAYEHRNLVRKLAEDGKKRLMSRGEKERGRSVSASSRGRSLSPASKMHAPPLNLGKGSK